MWVIRRASTRTVPHRFHGNNDPANALTRRHAEILEDLYATEDVAGLELVVAPEFVCEDRRTGLNFGSVDARTMA